MVNTLAANVFNARLTQANLITKTDFNAKLSSLNRNITANKSKHLLVGNEIKKAKNIWFKLGKLNMGTLVMELDLIENQVFHLQVVDLVKMQ